jgi:uncharacterized repeat protein (TIGR01451 family)
MRRAQLVAAVAVLLMLAMAGPASASGTVNLSWSPSGPVSYGTLASGATSPPKTFTLTNSGSSATSMLTIALTPGSGTPSSAFNKTADTCTGTSLGPKKSCSVMVTYTAPATPGQADQATLTASSNKPAATASLTLTGTSEKASPTLVTAASPPAVTLGTTAPTLSDSAVLSGGFSPTGSLVFTLSGPGGFSYSQTDTVHGDGTYPASTTPPTTGTVTGTYTWAAVYFGDSHNNQASEIGGAGEQTTVSPATPTVATAQQPASATVGSAVADRATVSDGFSPTGSVTFTLYDNPTCAGTPLFTDGKPLVGGVATSASYTATAAGTDYWAAIYNGDSNNHSVSSACNGEPVTITPVADLSITKTDGASSFAPGTSTTYTIVVSNNGPSDATGAAVVDTLPAAVSSDTWTATSTGGASGFTAPGSGHLNDTVNLPVGSTITYTLTANISPSASGNLVNTATVTPPVGVTDPNPGNNSATDIDTIIPTPTITTTQQPASATVGSTLADQATVSGGNNPTGTVTFNLYNNSTCAGAPLFANTESLVGSVATSAGYTATATGTDYWRATYNGDSNNNSVSSACNAEPVTVTPAAPG